VGEKEESREKKKGSNEERGGKGGFRPMICLVGGKKNPRGGEEGCKVCTPPFSGGKGSSKGKKERKILHLKGGGGGIETNRP